MKKQFALMALFAALALCQAAQAQIRLSISDQQRFDSYYSRWQSYKATNNQSEVRSMEGRMQDVYRHYGIPAGTPYGRVASNGGGGWRSGGWNGAPAPAPMPPPAPVSGAGPYYGHPDYRDHDWERRQAWEREHARDEHREWERRQEWREHERQEAHHDNGLHKGWYKDHDHGPHDHDHDRDHHDRDRDHHDRDRDHHDRDRDHDRDHH